MIERRVYLNIKHFFINRYKELNCYKKFHNESKDLNYFFKSVSLQREAYLHISKMHPFHNYLLPDTGSTHDFISYR